MGFFACISRRPTADSEALQKRDSQADFLPVKARIPASRSPGSAKTAERRRTAGEVMAKHWPVRAREIKPDAAAPIRPHGRREIWPESTSKISPAAPISV